MDGLGWPADDLTGASGDVADQILVLLPELKRESGEGVPKVF